MLVRKRLEGVYIIHPTSNPTRRGFCVCLFVWGGCGLCKVKGVFGSSQCIGDLLASTEIITDLQRSGPSLRRLGHLLRSGFVFRCGKHDALTSKSRPTY